MARAGETLIRILFSASLVLALTASAVQADACVPNTSQPEVTTCPLGQRVIHCEYVDNDLCQPACVISTWFYEESNDIPGLQRHDEVVDDTCGGVIESDTIWS